jgi:hypothetical protein
MGNSNSVTLVLKDVGLDDSDTNSKITDCLYILTLRYNNLYYEGKFDDNDIKSSVNFRVRCLEVMPNTQEVLQFLYEVDKKLYKIDNEYNFMVLQYRLKKIKDTYIQDVKKQMEKYQNGTPTPMVLSSSMGIKSEQLTGGLNYVV